MLLLETQEKNPSFTHNHATCNQFSQSSGIDLVAAAVGWGAREIQQVHSVCTVQLL